MKLNREGTQKNKFDLNILQLNVKGPLPAMLIEFLIDIYLLVGYLW